MKPFVLAVLAFGTYAAAATSPVMAHGGVLNRSGCHLDSRTKVYHCHTGPKRFDNSVTNEPATKSRIRSKRNNPS